MIYFLSVLQLLFQLITVSSRQCHERNVILLTGETKESSQNGYRYGIIQTPNFPKQFRTPYNVTYIIDASHRSNDSQINLYLTQMFLNRKGVRFFQRSRLESCEQDGITRKPIVGRDCRKSHDQLYPEIFVNTLHDALRVSTSCPYLEIEVTVPELYGYHYRTVDPFLFYVYGFNITYEIVPEKLGPKNESCNPKNCSNLGHCYLAENWREFYCDCLKDHPGRYCEFSPHCDPENNITFCRNGGRCSVISGAGYCDCSGTGFAGPKCDKRNEQPKVSARTGCSNPNECPIGENKLRCIPETSKVPCSCSPTPKVPKDWVKYEAIISISSNYTPLLNLTTVGYELQANISRYFESTATALSDLHNVLVRFEPPRYGKVDPPPEVLQIHFHGPSNLQDKVRLKLMNYLLTDENTYFFRKLVPLKGNMVLHVMPRVKYKSIEVSKKLKIGSAVSISCKAYTGKSVYFATRDIRFRWFKDGLPVNVSISSKKSRHIEIQFNTGIENETHSIIFIDRVTALDGGLYTCEITDKAFGDQICEEQEVEVILPPQIEIQPMSLTLEKRDIEQGGKVITCTDGSYSTYNPHNKTTTFFWYKTNGEFQYIKNNDVTAVEEITPQGRILRILKAVKSESFTCRGFNKEGEDRVRSVNINVLDSTNSPSCKQRWEALLKQSGKEKKLVWEWTAPDSTAIIPCPKGFIGYVQRQCIETSPGNVQWGRSDFSRCISDFLRKVNLTLQNAKRGFGHWEASNGIKLMDKLEIYLQSNQVLYPGEGEKIITILEDIWQYALEKAHVNKIFVEKFYGALGKLLKVPDSCVQEKSVHTLLETIMDAAVSGAMHDSANRNDKLLKPHIVLSDVLLLQTLAMRPEIKHRDPTYTFPRKDTLKNSTLAWLKDKLRLTFPLNSEGLWREGDDIQMMYYLTIAAYRNISYLLVPNENTLKRGSDVMKKGLRTTIELISPIVQVSMPTNYVLEADTMIRIHFNLSKEHRSLVTPLPKTSGGDIPTVKGTFYTCGALNNSTVPTKIEYVRLRWSHNACTMVVKHNSYVECQCDGLGIFGLLKVCNVDEEIREENNEIPRIIIAGFSLCILSCVVSVTLICVYLECRIHLNSLYTLKILDCLFVFAAVFIVLLGRTEVPSASWLIWSTAACSFLISSLSVQVTKALRVLLMEARPGVPTFILPWLKNVSQVTLLSAIAFSTVLPVWTATAAKIIRDSRPTESAFEETSYVFAFFVGTVTVVVLVFLTLYYKAVLKTKSELDEYRQQNPCPSNNMRASEMIWIFNYRIKTLNRGLCHTLILLVMVLGIVLYENIQQSVFIQYFLGISVTAMGIFLFLSNVFHSEYPILATLCSLSQSEKPPHRDPEKAFVDKKGSQRKLYPISSEVQNGNGSIVGTTGLLPPPPPTVRNTRALLGDDSSMSTVEEQSMDTFSTVVSFHTAAPSHKVSAYNKGYNRSVRSTSSNTTKSSNGSRRGSRKKQSSYSSEITVPNPGKCLISLGDYILPSIRNTTINDHRSTVQMQNNDSATSSSNYNYLPMPLHDNEHDIEKKISHDLSILLPQNDDHFGYPS